MMAGRAPAGPPPGGPDRPGRTRALAPEGPGPVPAGSVTVTVTGGDTHDDHDDRRTITVPPGGRDSDGPGHCDAVTMPLAPASTVTVTVIGSWRHRRHCGTVTVRNFN